MMKLTYGKLIYDVPRYLKDGMSPIITGLMKLCDIEFSLDAVDRLLIMKRQLDEQLKHLGQLRGAALKKYADENQDGIAKIRTSGQNVEKLMAEFGQIMSKEIELDMERISLPRLDTIKLTVNERDALDAFIEWTK